MPGLDFSIPYNLGLSRGMRSFKGLEEIFKLNNICGNKIREVYLSGPQEYFASGRIVPKMSGGEFIDIVDRIHKEL
jgi:hypothetical protein